MRRRPIYSRTGWVLCECTACKRTNFVEPHGTTAKCRCSAEETEHTNIPFADREGPGGMFVVTDSVGRVQREEIE